MACIDCPDGMEPSIPCGTVAKYGTHLHCVECKEGTFSDAYGEGQCKPCSVCSVGRTVAQNCSAAKNTRCGSCSYGYYESKVVFDCLPCSLCCWDGRDQFESQCEAQGLPRHLRCKPRHQRGCQAPWISGVKATSAAITDVRQNEGAMKQNSSSTTRKTTTIASEEKSAPLSPTTQEHFISTETGDQNTSSLIRSTDSATDSDGKSNLAFKKSKRSWSDSSVANKNRVIKGVSLSIAILVMIAVVVKRKTLVAHFKWARCHFTCGCRSSDAELGGATESSMLDDIKAPVSVLPKGGELYLTCTFNLIINCTNVSITLNHIRVQISVAKHADLALEADHVLPLLQQLDFFSQNKNRSRMPFGPVFHLHYSLRC